MNREDLIQEVVENLARCQRPANLSSWQKIGLSHAQVGLLFMLSYHHRLPAKRIAEFLGVSKSAVSQLIDPLVDKRFISREQDRQDRRIAYLSLTHKGKQMLRRLARHKFAGLRASLENLNERELKELHKLSTKMSVAAKQKVMVNVKETY